MSSLIQLPQNPNQKPHYVYYDLETSGLSATHDQILQFAAIVADSNFNTINHYNIRIKLRPDVVPSPQALLITQTTPEILLTGTPDNPAINEHDAIKKIFEIINTPETINLGYNSIHFDDQFLRFSFFRNFLPPYKHQWYNHCHRIDIYPAVLFAYHFYPEILNWPQVDGKPSFKLEHLVKANNMSSGVSHDAFVDVQDTIKLTKVLASNKTLWTQINRFFNKTHDKALIDNSPSPLIIDNTPHQTGFMMDTHPSEPIIPVVCLGQHNQYSNQTKWLRLDKISFNEASLSDIQSHTLLLTKKYGEPPFFFPCNDTKCTAKFSTTQQDFVLDNINWIRNNHQEFSAIAHNHAHSEHKNIPKIDASSALYQLGFPTPDVESLFEKFHIIEDERKLEVALKFKNDAHKELAIRILGTTYPDVINPAPDDSAEKSSAKQQIRDKYQQFLSALILKERQREPFLKH